MTATATPAPKIHTCPRCHIYVFGGLMTLATHLSLFHQE